MTHLDNHNANPTPFVCTKTANEIFQKVARAKQIAAAACFMAGPYRPPYARSEAVRNLTAKPSQRDYTGSPVTQCGHGEAANCRRLVISRRAFTRLQSQPVDRGQAAF